MKKKINIEGFENLYEITDQGEVVCLPRLVSTPTCKYMSKEKKTKGFKNSHGYMSFDLCKRVDGKKKRKTVLVHRLVAEYFIPNPHNYPQVNHKNGIKTDNRVENLEWCNNSMNQLHAFANGLQKGAFMHPNSKLTYEQVKYIKENHKPHTLGYGITTLAKKFNVCESSIKQILDGRSYRNIN